jgi:hypothetical protein
MSRSLIVYVDCIKDGNIIATYDFRVDGTIAAPPRYNRKELENAAKDALTTQRLAFPTYEGILFQYREVFVR